MYFFQTDRVLQWDWIRKRAITLTPAKKGHYKGHPFRNILIAACACYYLSDYICQKVQSHTLPRQKWKANRSPLPSPLTGGSKGTGIIFTIFFFKFKIDIFFYTVLIFFKCNYLILEVSEFCPVTIYLLSLNPCRTSACCVVGMWCFYDIFMAFPSVTPCFSTSGWDGRDDEQHKGRRRVSDRTGAAVHSWPLQEIFHSTLQEPSDQWEGSHTPDPAEHSQGECRLGRSKVTQWLRHRTHTPLVLHSF